MRSARYRYAPDDPLTSGIRFNAPVRNAPEAAFVEFCKAKGWRCSKRGWPDYVVLRGSDSSLGLALVEVKAHRGRRLKREQLLVLDLLSAYGVPCYRWSPDAGLQRVGRPAARWAAQEESSRSTEAPATATSGG